MSDSFTGDNAQLSTDAAAGLLQASHAVSDRVREALDTRTEALGEAWMAVAVIAYSFGFALTSGGIDGDGIVPGLQRTSPGLGFAITLLVPIFAALGLQQGLRERLRIVRSPKIRRHQFIVWAASVLPFVVVGWLLTTMPSALWPASLVIAVGAAAPLGWLAFRSGRLARDGGVRRPAPAVLARLSPASQAATLLLGLGLGAISAMAGLPMLLAGALSILFFFFALVLTHGTQWGLPRLADEWGREQWMAFGCAFLLQVLLAVTQSRTTWDLSVVSIVGGILIAAPLGVAAFRPAPIWAAR